MLDKAQLDVVTSGTPSTSDCHVAVPVPAEPSTLGTANPAHPSECLLPGNRRLITVRETAGLLGLSETWVRRHKQELPIVRTGRLVRFDSALLEQQFRVKQPVGNRLKTGGAMSLPLRRYQRGYVYKAGKRMKMWYGMYRQDVRKANGQIVRRQKNVRLGTLADIPTKCGAQNKLLELMVNSNPSVEMSFGDVAERWQYVTSPNSKATTADYYAKVLRAYVVPMLGAKMISAITRNEIQEFLIEQSKLYSRSSVHGMKIAISLVMQWAVDNDWIKKNPAGHLKTPREEFCGGKKIIRNKHLSADQVRAIAERLKEPVSTLVWFLSVSGLRIGEAVAVRWSDFNGNVLHIQRRLYEGAIDKPKSKKSERHLPIPDELLQRLRSLGTKDWVFAARNGSPLNQGNVLRRHLRPVLKELQIELGGWHDFRHSQSTVMRQGAVPAEVRAGILGHSLKQTEDYGEVSPAEFQGPLTHVANQLLRDVTETAEAG
jgi:integrase